MWTYSIALGMIYNVDVVDKAGQSASEILQNVLLGALIFKPGHTLWWRISPFVFIGTSLALGAKGTLHNHEPCSSLREVLA